MPQPLPASGLRIALIDDDSGMITVLDRRFAANRWERQVIGYAADPEQLTALKLHALIVNPAHHGARLHRMGRRPAARAGAPGVQPPRAGGRPRACPAQRRRRLDHQALPSRGAGGPHRGGAAPPPGGRAAHAGRDRHRRRAGHPARPLRRLCQRRPGHPLAQGVRAAGAAGRRRRAGAGARGDLPAGVGLHDGAGRPFGGRVRAQAAPEARGDLPGLALRAHALRCGLPVRRRARRRGGPAVRSPPRPHPQPARPAPAVASSPSRPARRTLSV